ncbi:MAG: hypothetical protein IPL84_18200 [Chitinophagaceae bacterium]|nr:hypothetical protein [Chitinophagaceae bacterium]
MKQFILKNKKALTGTLAMILVAAVTMSFQDFPFDSGKLSAREEYYRSGNCTDTMPEKNGMKMKDFEKLQSDLDKTLSTVGDELKKMDFSKMQKDLETSLKEVDMEKIRTDVAKALKNIDMDRIMADARSSLQNLDLGYKQAEIEKAFAEAKKKLRKPGLN